MPTDLGLQHAKWQRERSKIRSAVSRTSGCGPNVLQLIHCNEAGGVEALAADIAQGLADRGARVETRFLYPSINAPYWRKVSDVARTAAVVMMARPDIVIAY